MAKPAIVFVSILVLTGCAGQRIKQPRTKRPPVQVVTREQATASGFRARAMVEPFYDGANGTMAVLRFLAIAGRERAKLASDLEIETNALHGGKLRRCITKIGPAGSLLPQPPTTDRKTTREVSEKRASCHFEYQPAPVLGNPGDDPTLPTGSMDNDIVRRCSQYDVSEDVTRWESQFEARLIPPDWEQIAKQHATGVKLEESEPSCVEISGTLSSTAAPHRIRARVYP